MLTTQRINIKSILDKLFHNADMCYLIMDSFLIE